VDVSYGCTDITEVVSWLLNEDTEAADVTALGRDIHEIARVRQQLMYKCAVSISDKQL